MNTRVIDLTLKEAMDAARAAYLAEKDPIRKAELKREFRKARNRYWWAFDHQRAK